MTITIAPRVQRITPSPTLEVTARAQALIRAGRDIISFGIGEPDFATPEHIQIAAAAAVAAGASKYTAVAGIPELRAAVAAELSTVHGVSFRPEEVVVSTGAKQSLFNTFMAILADGDEVIVPTPCWPSHVELVRMAGGVPVLLPQRFEDSFHINAEELKQRVGKSTRALLLNSPANPTGAVYSRKLYEQMAEILREHPQVVIVTDDLYRRLVYAPRTWTSFLQVAPDFQDRTVVIDGVSKTYAMTGWRIGYSVCPQPLAQAMQVLQGQVTTNAAAVSQHAALAAITGDQAPALAMADEFDRRRKVMYAGLAQIPGLRVIEPEGAFYCLVDVSSYLSRHDSPAGSPALPDDVALADWLLSAVDLATVPGTGFFAPGFLRLSYATSLPRIESGLERLRRGLSQLRTSR